MKDIEIMSEGTALLTALMESIIGQTVVGDIEDICTSSSRRLI